MSGRNWYARTIFDCYASTVLAGLPGTVRGWDRPVMDSADLPTDSTDSVDSPERVPLRPVTAVVLDVGNVLYAWEAIGAVAGRVPTALWHEFCADADFGSLNARADAGEPLGDILADLVAAHPDRPEWERIQRLYWDHFEDSLTGPVPGMAPLVDDLLAAGAPLYALTNFNDVLFAASRRLMPQLARFHGVVVSGAEHLVKPDPALYRILLTRYGLDPACTLFVDDSPANIDGARGVGLRTHLFTGAGALRAALADAGLLPPRRHRSAERAENTATAP